MKTWHIIAFFVLLTAIAAGTGYLVFKKPAYSYEPELEPVPLEPVKE